MKAEASLRLVHPVLHSVPLRSVSTAENEDSLPVVRDLQSQPSMSSEHFVSASNGVTNPVGLTLSAEEADVLDRLSKVPVLIAVNDRNQRIRR